MDNLNIVFFGEDTFSTVVLTSLLDAGYNVKLVITPLYDNLAYKKLELKCHTNNIPFARLKDINSQQTIEKVKSNNPDLCVVAHFEKLIKNDLLRLPKLGFINLHPSLLPEYRGISPQHWPIINGEKEAGISVHYIDDGIDTGDIIVQRKFALEENMYVSDLQKRWILEYKTIVIEAINKIKEGSPVKKQKFLQGSYYGKLKDTDCVIGPDSSVEHAYNMVRGLSLPYHGAQYEDKIIYRAHIGQNGEQSSKAIKFKDGILVLDKYKILGQ